MAGKAMQKGEKEETSGVMEDSGLTEEERRQIRKEQRQLLKELEEKDTLELEEARDRNNQIYKKVRYAREAVLDGENLISIANKASQKVDRLIQVSLVEQKSTCLDSHKMSLLTNQSMPASQPSTSTLQSNVFTS